MKQRLSLERLHLLIVLILLLPGCAQSDPAPGLILGVERVVPTSSFIQRQWIGVRENYLKELSSDQYQGTSFIQVSSTYDIRDGEHVIRVATEHDAEEFSTRSESLDMLSSTMSHSGGDTEYTVLLAYPAELSSDPVPDNGILEIDAEEDAVLTVEWTYPSKEDTLESEFVLSSGD